MPLPVALRALAHRNFRLFVAGQLTSLVGTWMQMVAQGWLVYRLTGASLQLGLVGFASQIPVFLTSPAGGVIADRWSRRRVLIATQSAMMALGFVLAALTLSGEVRLWHVYVLAAMLGPVIAEKILHGGPSAYGLLMSAAGVGSLAGAAALAA